MAYFRKTRASLTAAILFYLISAPFTYELVNNLVNVVVSAISPAHASLFKISDGGRPTTVGLIVHSIVYGLITYSLMTSD